MTGRGGWRSQGLVWLIAAVLLVAGWSGAEALQRGRRLDVGEHRAAAFLRDFRAVERSADGTFSFQWSRAASQIVLPRVRTGEVRLIALRIIQRAEQPPRTIELSAGRVTVPLPVLPASSRVYRLLVPDADALTIRSDLSGITDAELSQIGVMVDWLQTAPLRGGLWPAPAVWAAGFALAAVSWLCCVLLGIGPTAQRRIAGGLVLFGGYLALNWLPEVLRGSASLPLVAVVSTVAALGLRGPARPWLGASTDAVAGSVLLWLFWAGIGISYPGFIPTDSPFHLNRLLLTLGGNFFMTAEGQGQTYPYPAGVYLLLAPLSALTGGTRSGLQWIGLAAVAAQTAALSVYLVRHGFSAGVVRLNALLCAVLPAGFLLNTQGPLAQNIGGLLSTVYLLTVVDSLVQAEQQRVPISATRWWVLVGLGFAVGVGHFGVLLNTLLLSVLLLLLAPRALWAQRRIMLSWLTALGLAGLLVYSVYLPVMIEQLGRLTNTDSPPSRWFLLTRYVFDIALFGHYRVLFVITAVAGWLWLYRRRASSGPAEQWLVRWSGAMLLTSLLLLSLKVAIFFNATRYAIFAWPAISVLSAIWLQRYDRPGWRRAALGLLLAATLVSTLLQWFSVFALQSRNGFLG